MLVEPTKEVHVSDLDLENFGALGASQVPPKQHIHQLDQSRHPQVHHQAVCHECVNEGLFGDNWVERNEEEAQTELDVSIDG